MSRWIIVAALSLAFAGGALAAFVHHDEAEAISANLLAWNGATHELDGWWKFCVGKGGPPPANPYHGNAIDVFADAAADCGGPSQVTVTANTQGYSLAPNPFWLMGAYQREMVGGCHTIWVQAAEFTGNQQVLGREVMFHSYRNNDDLDFYLINMGSGTWLNTPQTIGFTVPDPNCGTGGWLGHHVHQTYDVEPGSPVNFALNPVLTENTVYDLWDVSFYIHMWDW